MRYLVLSDIHGNLPALESILKVEQNIDAYINLGDVVNYGPWSNECVQLLHELDCQNILGNHEDYFISGHCPVQNPLVRTFFQETFSNFNELQKIEQYDKQLIIENVLIVHTLSGFNYIFRDSPVELEKNAFIGHSHQQYLRFKNNFLLANPGSVGQNRTYINQANYIVWNTATGEIDLKFVKYNLKVLLNEMKARKYPEECINYYKNKKHI